MADTRAEPKALESKLNLSLDELIRQQEKGHRTGYGRGSKSSGREASAVREGQGGRVRAMPVHIPHGPGGDAGWGRGGGHGRHGGFRDRGPQRLVHLHDGPPMRMLQPDPTFVQPMGGGGYMVQGFGMPFMSMPAPMERSMGRGFNGGFGLLNGGGAMMGFGGDVGPPEHPFVQPPRPVCLYGLTVSRRLITQALQCLAAAILFGKHTLS